MIILITKTPRINKQSIMPISDNILCYFAIKQINNYMQGESLKLRISQLKKASIELKSKVLTQNKIDIEAVSDILNSILPQKYTEKIVNSHQHSSKDSVTVRTPKSNSQNGGLHSSANSLAYSPASSIFTTPSSVPLASNINKSAPDRLIIQQRSSSHESLTQSNSIDIQLQKLKRKNQELQNQISAISDDIFNLRKKEKAQQEQEWKDNLPFQYKKGQIGVFITRLFLKQYDFDKIDYQSAKTEIIHDRLLIQMPMKPCRQYKLTNLVEVKYVGDKVMKIDFKIDQTVFVFLQFQTIAQRQSWDLALFVNHKIITNKELDRSLFFQKKQKTDSKDNDLALHFVKKSKSKSSLRFAEDRVDQRTNEQRYLDSKNENFKKGSLKVLEKRTDRSIMSKGSFNSQNKQEESSRYINQFEYTLNGHNQSLENSPIGRESVPANSDNDRVLKDLIVFGLVGDSHNQSRAHTSKFNLGQPNYETQDFGPPNSLPEQSMSLKHLDEDESQRWQGVMNRLKSGYFFTKYARNGMKPHNKHVFISPQEEMLCCVDTFNRNIRKQIPIQNIKRVIYPSIDQGIRKFINNPKTQNYCVIQYSMMGVSKFMQLGCQKVKFISRFASEITEFLRKKGVLIHD